MLKNTWEIKKHFDTNPEMWSNGAILAQHAAKLALLEIGKTLNIDEFTYKRETTSMSKHNKNWDSFYVQDGYRWQWVGNLWDAIEHYSANFTQKHWNSTPEL